MCKFLCGYMFVILLGIDIKVDLLGDKVRVELLLTLMFTFLRTAKLFFFFFKSNF